MNFTEKLCQHNFKIFLGVLLSSYLFYIIIVLKYTINFPFSDDYYAVLEYIINFNKEKSIQNRLMMLLSQHNEHRILLDRVIIVSDYYIFGEINFIALTVVGNLSILAIIILLFKSSKISTKESAFLYLIPSVFLIINLTYWELSFWAMASIQNFGVIALSFTSLYFLLHDKNKNIYISILFAFFATFTSGNGMMTFLAGATTLALNKRLNYKLISWLLAGVLSILLYFHNFNKPNNFYFLIENFIQTPTTTILFALNFLGSFFREYNAVVAGIIVLIFSAIIVWKNYAKENPIIFSFILFIIFTIIPLSFARSFLGIEQALTPRYAINSLLLFVCCYFALIELTKKSLKIWPITIVISAFLWIHIKSYSKYLPSIKSRKENFTAEYNNIKDGDYDAIHKIIPIDLPDARNIINQSDSLGIFENNKIFNYKN